jgi:hypothetical protein
MPDFWISGLMGDVIDSDLQESEQAFEVENSLFTSTLGLYNVDETSTIH